MRICIQFWVNIALNDLISLSVKNDNPLSLRSERSHPNIENVWLWLKSYVLSFWSFNNRGVLLKIEFLCNISKNSKLYDCAIGRVIKWTPDLIERKSNEYHSWMSLVGWYGACDRLYFILPNDSTNVNKENFLCEIIENVFIS